MRQIVLDTETTGLEPAQGHRIIEIGCVELDNRRRTGRQFHQYLQPDREIDAGAVEVHGITNEFLEDKPRFEDVADDFITFIRNAELIIHNAPFDVGFINAEFKRLKRGDAPLSEICAIFDTLAHARQLHPGQRNSLDALCKRYDINNSHRDLHGALLDAEILADVYLTMTGGQAALLLDADDRGLPKEKQVRHVSRDRKPLCVVRANDLEVAAHNERLDAIEKSLGSTCVWRKLGASEGG